MQKSKKKKLPVPVTSEACCLVSPVGFIALVGSRYPTRFTSSALSQPLEDKRNKPARPQDLGAHFYQAAPAAEAWWNWMSWPRWRGNKVKIGSVSLLAGAAAKPVSQPSRLREPEGVLGQRRDSSNPISGTFCKVPQCPAARDNDTERAALSGRVHTQDGCKHMVSCLAGWPAGYS